MGSVDGVNNRRLWAWDDEGLKACQGAWCPPLVAAYTAVLVDQFSWRRAAEGIP